MDIIEMARNLGKAIQEDDTYIKLKIAQQAVNDDKVLQDMIGNFNMLKLSANNEMTKDQPNQEKIKSINEDLRKSYSNIMENPKMAEFNKIQEDFNFMINRLNSIIMKSAQGEDPMTADYEESCGGNCSSCSGCH